MSSTLRARNTPAVDTDRVDPVPAYTANDLRVDAQDAERTRLYTPHIPASDDRFFTAIRANDITLVTQLLDENPLLVHSHDPSIPRVTALYAAVDSCLNGSARGKTFIVALLAERGADVNGISSTGNYHPSPSRRYSTRVPGKLIERTPLMAAAEAGSLPLVRLLYEDLHADDGIVAPDGEIALRLAVRNQHREIVQLLPTRRRGGWRRFKHQHQIAMYRIKRAGTAIYHFFKFFVWEVPKFFLWTLPKWVVWPIIRGLFWELPKYLWKKLVAFVKAIPGAVVKGYNATVDGVVKGYEAVKGFVPRIPRLAANAARAVWNGLKKLGHSIWEFLKSIPGVINDMLQAIWKMLKATPQFCWNVVKAIGRFIRGVVKGIWWITKETTLWFWKLFTQTIPQLLLSIGRFIIRAFVSLGHFTLDFLTKIASLVDTVFNAIITRLRAVTLADIGRALYAVVVSVPIWLWESFLNVCEAIRKGTVWTLEQMGTFVHFMAELIFALIMYVPTKTAEIALAVGHIAAAGGREVARWVSPKSNI